MSFFSGWMETGVKVLFVKYCMIQKLLLLCRGARPMASGRTAVRPIQSLNKGINGGNEMNSSGKKKVYSGRFVQSFILEFRREALRRARNASLAWNKLRCGTGSCERLGGFGMLTSRNSHVARTLLYRTDHTGEAKPETHKYLPPASLRAVGFI